MEAWTDFAVATAGATAALAGLVIVTISVNVREILRSSHLVRSAGATIGALIAVLLDALAVLVPQSTLALGLEVLATTAVAGMLAVLASASEVRALGGSSRGRAVANASSSVLWVVALAAAAVLFCLDSAAAPYALALGTALAVVGAIINTWVLLIEILR